MYILNPSDLVLIVQTALKGSIEKREDTFYSYLLNRQKLLPYISPNRQTMLESIHIYTSTKFDVPLRPPTPTAFHTPSTVSDAYGKKEKERRKKNRLQLFARSSLCSVPHNPIEKEKKGKEGRKLWWIEWSSLLSSVARTFCLSFAVCRRDGETERQKNGVCFPQNFSEGSRRRRRCKQRTN